MTRDEFTADMFAHYQTKNRLVDDRLTLEQSQKIWWESPLNLDRSRWRLSMMGLRQLLCKPEYLQGKKFSVGEQNLVVTPKLTQSLHRMGFPWFMTANKNVFGKQIVNSIWLFDSQSIFWLALCDNNLPQFLNSL